MTKRYLLFLILILLSLQYIDCASAPPTYVATNKFVAGLYSYARFATAAYTNHTVTVPYTTALSSVKYSVALGIVNFKYNPSLNLWFLTLTVDSPTTAGFSIKVSCNSGSAIQNNININYLTVDGSFPDDFTINANIIPLSTPYQGPCQNTLNFNFSSQTNLNFTLANNNVFLLYQNHFHLQSPTGNEDLFSLEMNPSVLNESFYSVKIVTYDNIIIRGLGFSKIIFDKTKIQNNGLYYFNYGQSLVINGNGGDFTNNPYFSNNFMIGARIFNISSGGDFNWQVNRGPSISFNSGDTQLISFPYLHIKFRTCANTLYPYFHVATALCYDICPSGTYGDNTTKFCLPCHYSCKTCSAFAVCLTCQSTYNRVLNGTSCPPTTGYFDNGTAPAVLCSSVLNFCTACLSSTVCTSCQTGYIVSPSTSTCVLCSAQYPNCASCNTSPPVSCILCQSGFILNSTGNCQACSVSIQYCTTCSSLTVCTACSTPYVVAQSGSLCASTTCVNSFCATCSIQNTNICYSCTISGYYVINQTCVTTCGDGIKVGLQQCDDNNTVDGDGCNADCTLGNNNGCPASTPYRDPITSLCSATCPDRYYVNMTAYLCSPCYYTCLTCSNSTGCLSCSSANNRYLDGTQCLPNPGYYDNSVNQSALLCVSPCVNCISSSSCLSCVSGYYLSGTSCLQCSGAIPYCANCTSSTACSSCQFGFFLNTTTSQCSVLSCTDVNCELCLGSASICTQCITGYQVNSGTCRTVCGDGVRGGNQQCDDNNTIDGDGCNKDCTFGNNNSCPAAAPYRNPATNNCSSSCPSRFFANPAAYACQPCYYTCLTCTNNTDCVSCSSSNNRYLNGTQCLPLPGFYDNLVNQSAIVCVSPCSTCTSSSACNSCIIGYYISVSSCLICSTLLQGCHTCSSTTCTSCKFGYTLNPTTNICQLLPCSVSNCHICQNSSSSSICLECISGYHVQSGICKTLCGDGIIVGTEQCDDNNTIDGDGCNKDCTFGNNNSCPAAAPYRNPATNNCSSSCPSRFFANPAAYACQPCYYTCLTCTNNTDCVSCSSSNNRYLNGTQCLPLPGFYDNLVNQSAIVCVSPCSTCVSSSACTNCISGYYLTGTSSCATCSSTIPFCLLCSSSSVCTLCQSGYVINAGTTTCTQIVCTDPNCAQCLSSVSVCTQCILGYQPTNGTCFTVCGDGVRAGSQVCDDGNTVDGDGCNKDCTLGNNNGCSAAAPFRNPFNFVCSMVCPNTYFTNLAAYLCQPCFYTCLTCVNSNQCTSCSTTNNRYLNGTLCVPYTGYFDEYSNPSAVLCIQPCLNCVSSSLCTSCILGYYLQIDTCLSCMFVTDFCVTCDSSSNCLTCQTGYFLNTTTGLCDHVPCDDLNCLLCPNSAQLCTQCLQGFQPVSGICRQVCGDFIKTANEQCDDGNLQPNDGCSLTCTVETDFTCELVANVNRGSSCYFVGQIKVDIVYIDKVDNENKIEVLLRLQPSNLKVWDEVNFADMIELNSPVPITDIQITRNPDGTVKVVFKYEADIQGVQIEAKLNPAGTGNPTLMRAVPSSQNLLIESKDNEGAYFYDEQTYNIANIISLLCTAASAIGLTFFLIGMIYGKMIAVEMMAVLQVSFLSLLNLTQVNPCFAALSSLRLANGFNLIVTSKDYLINDQSPTQSRSVLLSSLFAENFNITSLLVFVPLLIALMSFILSKTVLKDNAKCEKVFKKSVGEYTFNGLMFCGYVVGVSFALQVSYGIKRTGEMLGMLSLVMCVVMLILMVIYEVFLFAKPGYFGEYSKSFKTDSLSSKYYNFMLVQRVLIGSCLVFMISVSVQLIVPIVLFLVILIFVVVKKPFKQNYHTYRVVGNMIVSCLALIIYTAYKMVNQKSSSMFFYLPLIICFLLLATVVYNSAAIVYEIYRKSKKQQIDKELQKVDIQQMFKNGKQSLLFEPNSLVINSGRSALNPKPKSSQITARQQINLKDIKAQFKMQKKQNNNQNPNNSGQGENGQNQYQFINNNLSHEYYQDEAL